MELQRYQDTDNRFRSALVAKEGRVWMSVLVVEDGRLRLIKRPLTDRKYMSPLQTNERKALASIRRLSRKAGTSRKIRAAVKEI